MDTPCRVLLTLFDLEVSRSLATRLRTENYSVVTADPSLVDQRIAETCLTAHVTLVELDGQWRNVRSFLAVTRQRSAHTRVLAVAERPTDDVVRRALDAGACGFIESSEPLARWAAAVRLAAHGVGYLSPALLTDSILDDMGAASEGTRSAVDVLTAREREVLTAIAHGYSKKEIATRLTVSERTVNTHAENLMRKLDVHGRVELTRLAIREGLIEP